jgi:hypothetical protein
MKPEDLVKGKIYVYKNKEPLIFDEFPSAATESFWRFRFYKAEVPNPKPRYLSRQDVSDFITELEIEKMWGLKNERKTRST